MVFFVFALMQRDLTMRCIPNLSSYVPDGAARRPAPLVCIDAPRSSPSPSSAFDIERVTEGS